MMSPSALGAALARGLTLGRFFATPVFLWLLLHFPGAFPAGAEPGSSAAGGRLAGLYLAVALSDWADGALARWAGRASPRWGWWDALADISFNVAALSAAARLGLVGAWVPAGVAAVGGRFLLANRGSLRGASAMRESFAGKGVGVACYLLVGAAVAALVAPGAAGRWAVARAGDALFAAMAAFFLRGLWRGGTGVLSLQSREPGETPAGERKRSA